MIIWFMQLNFVSPSIWRKEQSKCELHYAFSVNVHVIEEFIFTFITIK
jgi:hypothetical protein